MKNSLTVNRVDFREISIPEGINAVSNVIKAKSRVLPLLESNNYLEKIIKAEWVNLEIKSDAQESLEGVLNSIENNLQRQMDLHSRSLVSTYNYNTSLLTTKILDEHNYPAKVFSLVEKPSPVIEVEGQGFNWRLQSIDVSNELVPAIFLKRLTILKYNNIIPDAMYVGVPFKISKPGLLPTLTEEWRKSSDKVLDALSAGIPSPGFIETLKQEWEQMEDPLLICGFGSSPVFLVQIGKWI